jgi:hypothetical protein
MAQEIVGTKIPDFVLVSIEEDGEPTTIYELLAEGKPLVLDIYAEW